MGRCNPRCRPWNDKVDYKEIAISKGRGLTEVGKVVYPTAQLYSTNSTGRLTFLKDIVGFSE
ncbi:MAG: hypothetical protein WA364_15345 [Candidatus Nitrosopolaris sp.]